MKITGLGYSGCVDTFADLMTVTAVLAGIGALLFLMSALDPTSVRRPPSQAASRDRGGLAAEARAVEDTARGA